MVAEAKALRSSADPAELAAQFVRVRARSANLCRTLETEDFVIQTMPSVSPTKWHLAHTTWFFEQFILRSCLADYEPVDPLYDHLFNSYYYTRGQMHPRAERGLLSRPTVREINDYRARIDAAVGELIETGPSPDVTFLIELGCHHEQQHQELMLTDIKHVLWMNPRQPALRALPRQPAAVASGASGFVEYPGGIRAIGAAGDAFCFDNEMPRHDALLQPYAIANRPVSCGEYRAFIEDGGYRNSALWLADGWAWINDQAIGRPLYWHEDLQSEFTLGGLRDIIDAAPVTHVSFYEADAYARWANARLPTEAEWECAADGVELRGNFMDSEAWHPQVSTGDDAQPHGLFGDTWEWTSSPYAPYPGFRPLSGSLGEYNGKFMCNQMVCRGGSCVTPADHIRPSYRNFFYPHEQWQFFGIRLARDVDPHLMESIE